jgi:MerR family transcriptional regulator, light-induced transcriptional regulator
MLLSKYICKYLDNMNLFTISQLQRFSGINVHSIRAWEKRYDALKPERSEGNTRYYHGNQLRRLLNIASLMKSEHKISELCSLPDSKLHELMNENLEKSDSLNHNEFLVSQSVAAALEFNESLFDKVFSRAIIQYGMEGAYVNVIYPALQRLGLMWSADSVAPAQEHFISNLIRQKLSASIDLLPVHGNSKTHWLLFLPEDEFHETGLLMANYLVRNAGHRCTYLGSNVPFNSLYNAVKQTKPTALLFFLVSNDDIARDKEFVRLMLKTFPQQKLFVASDANRLANIKANKNVNMLTSVEDLKDALKRV